MRGVINHNRANMSEIKPNGCLEDNSRLLESGKKNSTSDLVIVKQNKTGKTQTNAKYHAVPQKDIKSTYYGSFHEKINHHLR